MRGSAMASAVKGSNAIASTIGVTLVWLENPAPLTAPSTSQPMPAVARPVAIRMARLVAMPVTSALARPVAPSLSGRIVARIGKGMKAATAMAR